MKRELDEYKNGQFKSVVQIAPDNRYISIQDFDKDHELTARGTQEVDTW